MSIDLLLAWDWPYDEPFVHLLGHAFQSRGLELLSATPSNLSRLLDGLSVGRYSVRCFLDRASDTSPRFLPLAHWAALNVPTRLNPSERAREIWYKATLHPDLTRAGVPVPDIVRIPALNRDPHLAPPDLSSLPRPFCIKPDLGGGGWGVVTDATTWADVQAARQRLPDDDFILHEFVEPGGLHDPSNGAAPRRGWFRILYACGRVIPCWWDDRTLVYADRVTEAERDRLGLTPLWEITHTLARVARIHLFSAEMAWLAPGKFVVVDFINDPVDLRLQSHAREGMPDSVAQEVADAVAEYVLGA